ncbi:hypothetical protein LZ198_26680 [Myxococcus sp. K15C18031901]|uniref:hypothetical protein n=1 Tax=Myxococcus dinghuensis TaxID=2906761 RepID=UPI0020A76063|nr:hypothetical protein [Myxococcus dinghuensis]MCP3102464.1 hypothetical protein [Myxococcus dinghuensis]
MQGLRRRAWLAWRLGLTLGLLTRVDLHAADASHDAPASEESVALAPVGNTVDEGGEAPLSFTVTWSRPGDADLIVTTPTGRRVWYQNPGPDPGTDFGALELDDRVMGPERISWAPGTTPPSGVYHVCLFLAGFIRLPSPAAPVSYTLVVRRPGRPDVVFQGRFIVRASMVECDPTRATFIGSVHQP